jgi:hypothetical protein
MMSRIAILYKSGAAAALYAKTGCTAAGAFALMAAIWLYGYLAHINGQISALLWH